MLWIIALFKISFLVRLTHQKIFQKECNYDFECNFKQRWLHSITAYLTKTISNNAIVQYVIFKFEMKRILRDNYCEKDWRKNRVKKWQIYIKQWNLHYNIIFSSATVNIFGPSWDVTVGRVPAIIYVINSISYINSLHKVI